MRHHKDRYCPLSVWLMRRGHYCVSDSLWPKAWLLHHLQHMRVCYVDRCNRKRVWERFWESPLCLSLALCRLPGFVCFKGNGTHDMTGWREGGWGGCIVLSCFPFWLFYYETGTFQEGCVTVVGQCELKCCEIIEIWLHSWYLVFVLQWKG